MKIKAYGKCSKNNIRRTGGYFFKINIKPEVKFKKFFKKIQYSKDNIYLKKWLKINMYKELVYH